MAVFPENMNRLDPGDVPGSLRTLENYIRYMAERMEFSTRNMTRNVSAAGTSTVEVVMLLGEMADALSKVNTAVNQLTAEVNTTKGLVTELQGKQTEQGTKLTALETKQETQGAKLATLEGKQSEVDSKLADLQGQITALAGRVSALENGTEG